MLKTYSTHNSNTVAFKNPDGSVVIVTANPYDKDKILTIEAKNYILKPKSINTIVL